MGAHEKKNILRFYKNKLKSIWQKFKAVPTLNVAELVFFYSCKITPTTDDNLLLPIMSITFYLTLLFNHKFSTGEAIILINQDSLILR